MLAPLLDIDAPSYTLESILPGDFEVRLVATEMHVQSPPPGDQAPIVISSVSYRNAEGNRQVRALEALAQNLHSLGECLCGRAAQSGQVLVCGDCFDDPRHDRHWLGMQTHGHYVIPLTHAGRVLAVLTLYTRAGVRTDGRRMALLQKVGTHAGNGLQRLLQREPQTSSS